MDFLQFINSLFINVAHAHGEEESVMGHHMFDYSSNSGILSSLSMLLLWIAIIVGVIIVSKNFIQNGKNNKTPLDILKERYAKGEINKKEFEEKKKDLI